MRSARWRRVVGAPVGAVTLLCALLGPPANAKDGDIERWVDGKLSNHVVTALNEHPRFRNATVRFVVMDGGQPTVIASPLELRLRDRLQQRVVGRVDTAVAHASAAPPLPLGVACPRDVQYIVGIEIQLSDTGLARADVRALDAIENAYVPSIALQWQGRLLQQQRLEHRHRTADPTFRGDRNAPYDASESDLMAAELGRALRCALMRSVSGDYVIPTTIDADSEEQLGDLTELVANHLGGISSLSRVNDPAAANAALSGSAHRVDGDLFQYWVTLAPLGSDTDLQPLSVSVYARVPTPYLSAEAAWAESTLERTDTPLFESLSLVRVSTDVPCRTAAYRTRGAFGHPPCWALNVRTQEDAVVFVLNHQQNHGLVRLGDDACRAKTAARIARANEYTTIRLPADWLRDEWAPEQRWELEPDADTYYAIAVSNEKAARALAAHLDELPQRCTASLRSGYEGSVLANWLEQLSATLETWEPHVAWNAIKIKNVY